MLDAGDAGVPERGQCPVYQRAITDERRFSRSIGDLGHVIAAALIVGKQQKLTTLQLQGQTYQESGQS